MDLSKLVAPEGEKTVLMVGESHLADDIEYMIPILEHFKPTAIAIEESFTQFKMQLVTKLRELRDEGVLDRPLTREDYEGLRKDAGSVAMAYAAKQGVPLYFIDWQPFPPSEAMDIFTEQFPEHSFKDFAEGLEKTIINLYGTDAHEQALTDIYRFYSRLWMPQWEVDVRFNNEARDFHEMLPDDEAEAASLFYKYDLTPQGIAARNQYSALSLNHLQEERILYVGGHLHFSRDAFKEFDYFVPLHEMVDAQHKYYISMKSLRSESTREEMLRELGADEFPVKITKTVQPSLSPEVFK